MPKRSLRSATSKLSGLDFYGHPVGVNYRGSHTYGTKLGALCSIMTTVLICINSATLIASFANKSDQTEFY